MRCAIALRFGLVGLLCSAAACSRRSAESEPPAAEAPEPAMAPHALLRPVFDTTEGERPAGTAFIVRWTDGRHVLLTAHHLFGPMGGFSRELSAAELPKIVKSVRAASAADPVVAVHSSALVSIADARAFDDSDLNRDVAAFLLDAPGAAGVLTLASALPKQGERVYVLAEPIGKRPGLYPGRVLGADDNVIAMMFDDSSLDLTGASGAALLDARGQVAGMLLAGAQQEGELRGFANPVTAVRARLSGALAK